jgi:hypothetical protein
MTLLLLTITYTTVLQIVETSDDKFKLGWPMFETEVHAYHLDARKMANKIPKLDYGSVNEYFDCTHMTFSTMKLPVTTPD